MGRPSAVRAAVTVSRAGCGGSPDQRCPSAAVLGIVGSFTEDTSSNGTCVSLEVLAFPSL